MLERTSVCISIEPRDLRTIYRFRIETQEERGRRRGKGEEGIEGKEYYVFRQLCFRKVVPRVWVQRVELSLLGKAFQEFSHRSREGWRPVLVGPFREYGEFAGDGV